MTFGLPCITAVSDKATRKSSAQERPLATRFAQTGAVITIRLPAFATVAATTADGTITPAFSPPQSPRPSFAAFHRHPPRFSEQWQVAWAGMVFVFQEFHKLLLFACV